MIQPLDKTLRNRLERTVKDARDIAEAAARASLEQLGAWDASALSHLSADERELRKKLRVHGRQLGDSLNGGKVQSMDRLIEEVAYEHWHRMLFARFLAENNLLMYPDPDDPVAVTLEECEDLAADEGAANGWELAARFAARMLPQIFRLGSPVFQLVLPPEHQHKLERLLADLPPEVFTASDSLGWVYQFWQAKKKDEVNASEVKIGARELPAVTQLFTEPYMVSFLLDNSLGAWWAARRLSESALKNANSEEELRQKAAIPGVPLDYLRFVQVEDTDGNKRWQPAAGTFDAWPEQLADLKTLDPCCGSGHFLVAAFLMLAPMRMERDGLSAREAVDAVLRDNIHGLELDQRCVELAAFALALTAWNYPDSGGYRPLPELHLACSGLSVSVAKEEWKQLGLGRQNLSLALDWMYETCKDAPVLGSLLDPQKSPMPMDISWTEIGPLLQQALNREQSDEQQEAAVVAQGLAKAATLLAGKYSWVITNVPYLARGKQEERLRDFCEKHYPAAKNDLATVFLDRCLELCVQGGASSIVLPQNWLFLTSYKKFREKLLKNDTWHLIARLGPGAFETISGEVVKAILITLSRGKTITPACIPSCGGLSQGERGQRTLLPLEAGARRADEGLIRGVDVSEPRTAAEKAAQLLTAEIKSVEQAKQLENPDATILFETRQHVVLIGTFANTLAGVDSGDSNRFMFKFWELVELGSRWIFELNSVSESTSFGGREGVLLYENGSGDMSRCSGGAIRNVRFWGKNAVTVSTMNNNAASISTGESWCRNVACIVPKKEEFLPTILAYCSSDEFTIDVRKFNQKIRVAEAAFGQVPFDLDHWTQVAAEKYPNGLPKPYSDDPTQWLFHGHPCGSVIWDEDQKWTTHGPLRTDATVLQVAVARLLGYRWPAEEPSPPAPLPEGEGREGMELADEQREWVRRCEALLPYADEDGIVCIPPVRGEASASDRLLNLLAAAYSPSPQPLSQGERGFSSLPSPSGRGAGGEGSWSNDTLAALLTSADHTGKTLETWLREKFFTQHCKLFQHRPFIWHIWDGLRDGFAALINYHKLDHKLLETLIYTYLGDWISRQKQDITSQVDGAQERLAAAESLKKKLELILEGEAPHDIFIRWKPLAKQPIGWNPDLNDGIRLNIRPFLSVPDVGKRGAGCLRDKPNIKWEKDRGKDVPSAPWFHKFNGDRINDHHLILAEKCSAREERNV